MPAVGFATTSTFNFGSRTLVRDLLPVMNVTVATWSKGPVLVGFTLTVIDFLGAGVKGVDSPVQERLAPARCASGMTRYMVESFGELIVNQDIECIGGPGVPNDQLHRRFLVQVHAGRRLHVDGDRDGLFAERKTIQLRSCRLRFIRCRPWR